MTKTYSSRMFQYMRIVHRAEMRIRKMVHRRWILKMLTQWSDLGYEKGFYFMSKLLADTSNHWWIPGN